MGCHQHRPLLCSHLINCQLGIRNRTKRNILQPTHSPLYLTMWKHLINFGQRHSGFQTKSKPMTLLWKCGIGTGQWAVEEKLHEQFCQIFDPSNHDKGWGQWRVHLQEPPDKLDVWYQYWQKILAASGVTWKRRVGTFSDLFPLRQTPAVRRWTSGWAPLSRSSRWERTFRVIGSEWCKFRSSPTFSHFAWCSSVGLLPKAPHSSWLVRSSQTGAVETF